MINVDHFKSVNDRFGHRGGDSVLCALCELIDSLIRRTDQLFRVGGEEFCLISTMIEQEYVNALAEKLREAIASHEFVGVGKVTVSIGIACFNDNDTHQSIYSRADAALYSAKNNGRNCTVLSK